MIDGFQLGPLYIRFYGIVLMLGAVAGGWLATIEVKRRGRDPEMVWDLLVYLIIGGVIGARLWHVFTPPQTSLIPDPLTGKLVNPYFAGGVPHLLDIISIWKGGLGIPGTIIGGLIALWFYTRSNKTIGFLDWADIAAPSLALGQAIGRWGNFFNQELYGSPTNLPWKIYIDPAHRLPGYESVAYYHPLFAYESLLNLANMLLLLWLMRRYVDRLRRGDIFNIYLITYPIIRFLLEFMRLDSPTVLGIPHFNQWVMLAVAVIAAAVLVWRHRPGSTAPAAYPAFVEEDAAQEEPAGQQAAAETTAEDETPSEPQVVKRRRAAKKAG